MFLFLNSLIFKNPLFDRFVYFCAVQLPYVLFFAGFLLLLLYKTSADHQVWIRGLPRRITKCVHAGLALGGALAISTLMKFIFHVSRPFENGIHPLFLHSGGDSFPSGHATAFAALATVIYFHNRSLGVVFWVGAVLISVSRVVAGVHYPIDILAGWVIGTGIAYLSNILWRRVVKVTSY